MRLLGHSCDIPREHLGYGDTWSCPRCRTRWRCYEGPWVGGKLFERVTLLEWLFGWESSE